MPVAHHIMRIVLPEHECDPNEFFWFFERNNYRHLVIMADGSLACVAPLMFTDAIVSDLGPWTYEGRWCFEKDGRADKALDAWARSGNDEPEGWHRHPDSGRRRPDGDKTREYINL